jgi:hypothetical protein
MSKPTPAVRTGQAPPKLERNEFHLQFMRSYADPRFATVQDALAKVEEVAWHNYDDSRKAPVTEKAGPEFADPDYDMSARPPDRGRAQAARSRHPFARAAD